MEKVKGLNLSQMTKCRLFQRLELKQDEIRNAGDHQSPFPLMFSTRSMAEQSQRIYELQMLLT